MNGVMSGYVSNLMSDLMPDFLNREQAPTDKGTQGASQFKSAEQLRLHAMQKESQDVTLTTEEGDTVTISLMSQVQADYMAFDYTQMMKGSSTSMEAEAFGLSTRNSFSINVQGDLNDQEKADIAAVMKDLDGIMQDLVNGDLDGIMGEAMGLLDDTETISGLEAVLQFQQQVSVEQRSYQQLSGSQTAGGFPQHMAPGQGKQLGLSNVMAKISGQMMDVIEDSRIDFSEFVDSLKEMFQEAIDKLSLEDPEGMMKKDLMEQLQADLLGRLTGESTQSTQSTEPSEATTLPDSNQEDVTVS